MHPKRLNKIKFEDGRAILILLFFLAEVIIIFQD